MNARLFLLGSLLGVGVFAHATPAADAQARTQVHVVQPGETVQDVAAQYGLSPVSVMAANALENPDLLKVGQSLVVPPVDGVLRTVRSGDTLIDIANEYDVTATELVSANGLDSGDDLAAGETLVIPGVRFAQRAVQAASTQAAATLPAHDQTTSAAAPDPAPPAAAPATTDQSAASTYVVQDGDTLRSIAEAFKLDILALVTMNGLENPDVIRPGTQLQVSSHQPEHVVQAGDTLGDIAWQYSVDANALLRVNGLEDPDRIVIGMTLVMPIGATAPPATAQSTAPPPPAPPMPAPTSTSTPASRPAQAPAAPRAAAAPARAASSSTGQITAMVTGYALGAGAVSTRTASGTTVHWGTVAADTRLFPFGTRLRIEGLGDTVFTVEDTGSAVRGNVFDVWYPDAASARRLGARTRQVTILSPGGE
ncbi:MAG: LysM peptidoglycan-binding domain-containing protein [Chloroflexi bacterium]|nr:LysM peptidoglycan-binding domain-containing protein [Chloroflexota bacterium]